MFNSSTNELTNLNSSPNSNLFGPQFISDDNPKRRSNSRAREEAPVVQAQAFGKTNFRHTHPTHYKGAKKVDIY